MTTPGQPPPATIEQGQPGIPPTIISPLGRDGGSEEIPVASDSPERAVPPVVESAPVDRTPPAASSPPDAGLDPGSSEPIDDTQSQGESTLDYQTQRKAEGYDILMGDPATRAAIEQALAIQTGGVPKPVKATPSTPSPGADYVSRAEYDQLRGVLGQVVKHHADTQVTALRSKFPEFQKLEPRISSIVKANPNLSLEEGYHLAYIAQNGGKSPVGVRTAAPLPTEAGPGGGGARSSESPDPVARAQEQMRRLPPGQRNLEDSIRLAYDAAKEVHSGE